MTGGSYWPKTNASELHYARSFQGHPTWPYLARQIRAQICVLVHIMLACEGWSSDRQPLLYLISEYMQYFAIFLLKSLSDRHANLCKYIFLKISSNLNFHYMRILRMPLAFSSLWTWNWILVCSAIYWFMIHIHQRDISTYWWYIDILYIPSISRADLIIAPIAIT